MRNRQRSQLLVRERLLTRVDGYYSDNVDNPARKILMASMFGSEDWTKRATKATKAAVEMFIEICEVNLKIKKEAQDGEGSETEQVGGIGKGGRVSQGTQTVERVPGAGVTFDSFA